MLFNYNYKIQAPVLEPNKEMTLFQAKKMLPEYVFDASQLENNPLTFPEVKTLMDGITIGGHKISDVQQVLNIKDSWQMLLQSIADGEFLVSKEMFHAVNNKIAREESLEWGKFRTGSVGIAGTKKYKAPASQELGLIFDSELPLILGSFHPVEQAIRIFLWATYNQFYWDGNKRTARLMASGILINSGYGVFNIRTKDILEFNTLMVNFYETAQADNIVQFLFEKCIRYYNV
ncbi:MAG: Fic family protein [Anaerovoracaceae bacterium]